MTNTQPFNRYETSAGIKMIVLLSVILLTISVEAQATISVATVNNSDMIVMQKFSKVFEREHPEIKLNWIVLEENILREKTTTDVAAHGGQYDVVTIGPLETPIWGRRGWLLPLTDRLPPSYEAGDLIQSIRDGASYDGKLYALPFYAESSLTYYRKDLFQKAGLTMPAQPTYEDIAHFAKVLHDPVHGVYGVCLRGKPGWGENMAYISTLADTFGGRWFDESWVPQLTSPEWHDAVNFYVSLLQAYGPPGESSNGFNESLTLFENGRCAVWVDATVAAGTLADATQSKVSSTVGFAPAPVAKTPIGARWLWFWALAVPSSSKHPEAALKFIEWATSRNYIQLVAGQRGWTAIPPGTRTSTYHEPAYLAAAPFATLTYQSILAADPLHPTEKPVPYTGIQCPVIATFPTIGNQVGQLIASALVGTVSVDDALKAAQAAVERIQDRHHEAVAGELK